jgi:aminocarboxymuconate-semialdehyde decarboxylase
VQRAPFQEIAAVKRIDTHSHVIPETIIDAMRAQPDLYNTKIGGTRGNYTFNRGKVTFELIMEFYDADAKVESMDRKGLDISYISPGPQTFFYGLGPDDALKTARLVNDGLAKMVAARPERLRGMATLPMQHPEAAIA